MKSLSRIAVMFFLIAFTLSGCGQDSDSGNATPTPAQPDVADVLSAASARIAATQTMEFSLEVAGTTMIDDSGTIQLLAARGSLARPDLVDVQFQLKLLGTQTVSIRMISSGVESWTTDLISGNWGPAPAEFGYDPSRLFDTEDGLGPIMDGIGNPAIIESESIDGRESWHIRGTVPQEMIGPITAGNMHGETVILDLWVDATTFDLLRIRLAEPTDQQIEDPATWTMNLRDHDTPVTIEPPI